MKVPDWRGTQEFSAVKRSIACFWAEARLYAYRDLADALIAAEQEPDVRADMVPRLLEEWQKLVCILPNTSELAIVAQYRIEQLQKMAATTAKGEDQEIT